MTMKSFALEVDIRDMRMLWARLGTFIWGGIREDSCEGW